MAGIRNIRNQRPHLERGQVKHRLHLGELEKKVDYRKRKEIYQKKKQIEKVLKEKQMNKNPDEFHTGMIHTKIHDDGFVEKKQRELKGEIKLKNQRNELKEEIRILHLKIKRINDKIEQMHMHIPFRYLFKNSHIIYNGNEAYALKAENKKLKKKGALYEKRYNGLLIRKNGIMNRIRLLDNALMKTYKNDEAYRVYTHGKNKVVHQIFGPRLK